MSQGRETLGILHTATVPPAVPSRPGRPTEVCSVFRLLRLHGIGIPFRPWRQDEACKRAGRAEEVEAQ